MRLALYEPDIPQNTGAILRLGACFGVEIDVIEPCGFPLDDRRLKRVAMDYGPLARLSRHASWSAYLAAHAAAPRAGRIVLLTTSAATGYHEFSFHRDDVILLGRESAGVPAEIHARTDASVVVPMATGARSLNVAMAAAIVLAEALRQTGQLPLPPA